MSNEYRIPWSRLPAHGRRMRAWMENRGITLEEFGKMLEPPRTRQEVQRIMVTHGVRDETLRPVASAMGMSVERLTKKFQLDPGGDGPRSSPYSPDDEFTIP